MRRFGPPLFSSASDEGQLWLTWLSRLRWVALFFQATTFAFVFQMLDGWPSIIAWFAVMLVLAIANSIVVAHSLHHEVTTGALFGNLLLDAMALTVYFLIAGGPDNPFTALYMAHIAMAAVMLPARHAGTFAAMVLACYSTLHLYHLPLHYERHAFDEFTLLRFGQWVAFAITALSVTIFVVGIAATLRRRSHQLLEARDRTARVDRLRAVGTLAAGAAHELNTPLSTMGLRLLRIGRRHDDEPTCRDVEVTKEQLERCTKIVRRLLVGAGDPAAGDIERRPLARLVDETVRMWSKGSPIEVAVDDASDGLLVELPRVAFQQALTNLLENAREAQQEIGSDDPLHVRLLREGGCGVVEVADRGCGLPDDGADEVGTPFYTTKATGTGLGVFVARQLADGAGGGLQYLPRRTQGTVARWWFPEAAGGLDDKEAVGGG
ncbi:MAG: ATP-binding protein [Myxococcota bacterium]